VPDHAESCGSKRVASDLPLYNLPQSLLATVR
jgi:hypothetical protein